MSARRSWLLCVALGGCFGPPEGTSPLECADFQDNDGDDLVDCFDPDCVMREQCEGREGLDAAQCVDGLDNDQDGYYDCNDFDCFAAPLCQEDGNSVIVIPGTGGGGGGGVVDDPDPGPTGPAPFIHDPMRGVTLSLRISFDMDDFGDSLCAFSQVCDCWVEFEGAGAFVSGEGVRGTFEGTWSVTDTSCSAASGLAGAIWTQTSGAAFHTFRWTADGAKLDQWIAHQFEEDITPFMENQNDQGQFWITGMRADYPGLGTAVDHSETKVDLADLIYITTVFEFSATFD